MSVDDQAVSFWQHLAGDALYVTRRRRALAELAAALPETAPAERAAIARRSARLQARLAGERFDSEDAVALCRRLTLEGAEALQAFRRAATAGRARAFTGALGAPRLAARALALYGGAPELTLVELPGAGPTGEHCELLGRHVRCETAWLGAPPAEVFPILALLEPRGATRVVFLPPFAHDGDAASTLRNALRTIEGQVRARPEIWPWGARG